MSIVNTETGEITEPMSADEARRLTERIRIAATNYTEAKAKVLALVDEAKEGGAHVALGYKSWTAYLSDVLSDEPLRLAREQRPELSSRLADEGMSNVAIAKVLGVTDKTVAADIERYEAPTSEYSEVGPVQSTAKLRVTEGRDGRVRTTASSGQLRIVPRPAAERTLASIQTTAARAAREAQTLTPDQIRRVKAEAGHIADSLRQSIETLQRLVDALTPMEDQ